MPRSHPPTPPGRRASRAITLAVLSGLTLSGLAGVTAAPATAAGSASEVTDGLVLRYGLDQTSGTTVTDTSGNNRNGTLVNGGTWSNGSLTLDGVDDFVKLPDDVMEGLSSISVSVDVFVEPTQGSPYFVWGLGNRAPGDGGYLMVAGEHLRAAITPTDYRAEQLTNSAGNKPLGRGVWKSLTYTQTGKTGTLYEDGVQIGQNTNVTLLPSQIGNGTTTLNVLGESSYAPDSSLKGKVSDFRIYNRALSSAEVKTLALDDAERVAGDKGTLGLGDLSGVTTDLTLPTTGAYGSTVSWATSDASRITAAGKVTRPGAGAQPAAVTLTATITRGSETTTKAFQATVSPQDSPQDSPQAKADAAAAALALVDPDDVRGDLTLPTTGQFGSTVTWASSAPSVVSATGLVSRPANGAGSTTVTMTATVTVDGATATRAVELTVKEKPAAAPYAGYAFSYFTGNSVQGENIYFAASRGNNALRWDELNGGQPKLTSTMGEMGLRDPFLIRSPEGDKFYLIATDLSIGRNGDWGRAQRTGSRYLEVWESTDLVNWGQQRHVLVSPPTAGNTWAPEAYWDETLRQYVVFWASPVFAESDPNHTGNGSYQKMMYATTRDFVTFSQPKIWQDRGASRIDSTVIKDNGTYYRFTKDEGAGSTGCSDIIQEKSTSLTAVDSPGDFTWAFQTGCIGAKAGTSAVEGPSIFKANEGDTSGNEFYLFVDEYGGRGYIPLGTDDLENPNWKVPSTFRLPSSPRHGTVIPVTQAELDRLRAGLVLPTPVQANADGLVAHLPLTSDAKDVSGHGYDGTLQNGPTFVDGSLNLDGTDDYVKLPNDMLAGLDAVTVSSKVWLSPQQSGNYFMWNFGNQANGVGNGYLFATGDSRLRGAIATGNWTTEQNAQSGAALGRGAWHTVTWTQANKSAVLYLDGREVARNDATTTIPDDIGGGRTTANFLGRSAYDADRRMMGKLRDFRIYDRALSADEVYDLGGATTGIKAVELASQRVPAVIDDAASTVQLRVKPGTDLATLAPTYTVAKGSTVTGGHGDYSDPVKVTVTAADGTSRTWTVSAVVMNSPVIPGLYADPNIAEFDGTYYVYATTDGTPGWGGKDFYVWSSTNLLDWTRSEKPFLTLDGANGNVPWATGNAWAPTIIERGGKYYFYFSGHNASLNRKTIGVAVADSPTGPFTAQPQAMVLNSDGVTGQAIDPAAFRDPKTGKYYLFWGNGNPVYAELSDDMLSLKSGTTKKISGLTDFREGTFLNYRPAPDGTGLYHLTYSIDDTGSPNYKVGYATSTSIDGPWTYRGVILEKDASQGILGTGHSSIVQGPGTDEWFIAYHRFAIPGGDGTHRETTIDRLTFDANGFMQKVTPTLTSVATAPAVTASAPSGWVSSGTLTLTAPSGSIVQYRLPGGTWTTYAGPVTLPDGAYAVEHRARTSRSTWGSIGTTAVQVDSTAPVVTATLAGRAVTLAATDAGSGVKSVEYRLDGGAWSLYVTPVTLDGGAHSVEYRSTDMLGNVAPVGTLQVPATTQPGTGQTPGQTAPSTPTTPSTKATSTVTVKMAKRGAVQGKKVKVSIDVDSSAALSGQVQVFVGGRTVTATVDAAGEAVVKVKLRKAGKQKLRVVYLGSATVAGSEKTVTVKVRPRR
ncbi:family 43 glycosylhydrolase [Nocardioides flavescens]|uniref:Family 43 glycosylhydrolase n=1 Tax=Nocardioides flavescens TaxID=2691959 RepID=A0A6L7F197_9ACTN|nr:family 43 glycosylhydrolase [Nocardioides flavescens]MXG90142.1 family 43 glycosylhydrolase [Nocardioides flavescens]